MSRLPLLPELPGVALILPEGNPPSSRPGAVTQTETPLSWWPWLKTESSRQKRTIKKNYQPLETAPAAGVQVLMVGQAASQQLGKRYLCLLGHPR